MKTETIKRIDKIPNAKRKAVTKQLEAIIKKEGLQETRLVTVNYFSKYKQTLQRKQRIAELKKEIADLNKKK